jgi:hypothetical protein
VLSIKEEKVAAPDAALLVSNRIARTQKNWRCGDSARSHNPRFDLPAVRRAAPQPLSAPCLGTCAGKDAYATNLRRNSPKATPKTPSSKTLVSSGTEPESCNTSGFMLVPI